MAISAAAFSKDASKYLDRAAKSKETVDVETAHGNVVIISAAEFERLEEEAGIARGEADYEAGRVLTHEQMIAIMDAKIAEAKARLSQ